MHEAAQLPVLQFDNAHGPWDLPTLMGREWLLTNGLGAYASSTLAGVNTRRYHALFMPALPAPLGRMVVLPRLGEELQLGDRVERLDGEERRDGSLRAHGALKLERFWLDGTLPTWQFALGDGVQLLRRQLLVYDENTALIQYELKGAPTATLRLRPYVTFRMHDRPIPAQQHRSSAKAAGDHVEVELSPQAPPLRLMTTGSARWVAEEQTSEELYYRIEAARGLDSHEVQHSPGFFEVELTPASPVWFWSTTEEAKVFARSPSALFKQEQERQRALLARAPNAAQTDTGARLVLAADAFVIRPRYRSPASRPEEDRDARSVIAGYHWFTDWGRDTMISLEGLTLTTGRPSTAAAILRTFHRYVRDGLIPNLFPEGTSEGLYHTADATLWFFHALNRYLRHTNDAALLTELYPTLAEIISHHEKGTHYGIGVDPSDGLLRQGAAGYQLTWMDAKVDDWVVTPRRGKAVEINALWFNALSLMNAWSRQLGKATSSYADAASRAKESFNRRFWNEATGCLFDVLDGEAGNDPAVRPNQVFAISLDNPVLDESRWAAVLGKVQAELVTPVGLRSLSPSHPDYKAFYDGDLRARDAAYHQGTVWAWLIGHYVDAVLRVNGDKAHAESLLLGLETHLRTKGVGQVSEIFDAQAPFHDRGCVAQAWSVAELLRVWVKVTPAG